MKISEAIAQLEALRAEHGDLELTNSMVHGVAGASFVVRHLKTMTPRETKVSYWNTYDGEERRDRKVIGVNGGDLIAPRRAGK